MMKNAFYRFYQMEHPVTMLVAIVLITLGHGMAKKSVSDEVKYAKAFRYFLIALILIVLRTPWPYMKEVGRSLFPGM
jgi:threonine/homoserine efflux transporter RhtA